MSRKVIIAGNWKMNKTASEGVALVKALKGLVELWKNAKARKPTMFSALNLAEALPDLPLRIWRML